LTIEGWAQADTPAAGVAPTISIGCDPANRTTGWDTTGAVPSSLIFNVPVRLNL